MKIKCLTALTAFLSCSLFVIIYFYIVSQKSVHSKTKLLRPSFMVSRASPVASVVMHAEPKELGGDHKDPVASVVVSAEPPISCCSMAAQRKLEDLCPKNQDITLQTDGCDCVDYMLCKIVMVTAISSNHYEESQDFFGSVRALLPHTEIIVYDLGLKKSQSETLASYCNTKVRQFDFSKYPDHTKRLSNYAWKPLIVEDMSKGYELFLYCDASCRVDADFLRFLPNIVKFPILPCSKLGDGGHAIKTTHDGMLKYLQMNMTRAEIVKFSPSFQAGAVVYWANDFVKEQFLAQWVDCAMHMECIAPKGADLYGCDLKRPIYVYAGCHRFDQSAFNAILIRDFPAIFNGVGRIKKSGIKIERWATNTYAAYIKKC